VEGVQQDAIQKYNDLDHHDIKTMNCPQGKHALELNLTNATGRCGVRHGCFWKSLNAYVNIFAF